MPREYVRAHEDCAPATQLSPSYPESWVVFVTLSGGRVLSYQVMLRVAVCPLFYACPSRDAA
jgi:hypothetical protein